MNIITNGGVSCTMTAGGYCVL